MKVFNEIKAYLRPELSLEMALDPPGGGGARAARRAAPGPRPAGASGWRGLMEPGL